MLQVGYPHLPSIFDAFLCETIIWENASFAKKDRIHLTENPGVSNDTCYKGLNPAFQGLQTRQKTGLLRRLLPRLNLLTIEASFSNPFRYRWPWIQQYPHSSPMFTPLGINACYLLSRRICYYVLDHNVAEKELFWKMIGWLRYPHQMIAMAAT